jgi:hypothetical protein
VSPTQRILAVLALGLCLGQAACGDHYTTQEAYSVCDDIIKRLDTTTEEAFADCVDCYESCGDECEQEGPEFICPED